MSSVGQELCLILLTPLAHCLCLFNPLRAYPVTGGVLFLILQPNILPAPFNHCVLGYSHGDPWIESQETEVLVFKNITQSFRAYISL